MLTKHLTPYTEPTFQQFRVHTDRGPLIKEYLERAFRVTHYALDIHPRTFAIRVDLHFPDNMAQYNKNVITRFFTSLKEQLKHNREQATKKNRYAHQSSVNYVWCKELSQCGKKPHYHVLILLNADAFDTLGHPTSTKNNMAARIKIAWLRALGYDEKQYMQIMGTLIHFCENGTYKVSKYHDTDTLAKLLYRLSYFCKADTKDFTLYEHPFGCSRMK